MGDQEEFIEYLALTKRLSDKSIELYMNYHRRFGNRVINQKEINAFIQECGNNDVVRGFVLAYITFKGLNKIIDLPPRPTGRVRKRIVRPISMNEIRAMSSFLYRLSFTKGLMFDLIYQGGLRKLEVPTIRINSFLWKEWETDTSKFLKLIVLGKNNKERIVLINPETAKKLLLHCIEKYNLNDDRKLNAFYTSPSLLFRNLTLDKLYQMIKFNSIKAIGRDIRPHELRHQRANDLEKRGVPVQEIKIYLGHANLSTTEKYLHKDEKEAIDNISNRLTSQ